VQLRGNSNCRSQVGYGNAIVPPLAAEFVMAFMESLQ
jgi:hypothetical protein